MVGFFLCWDDAGQPRSAPYPRVLRQCSSEFGVLSELIDVFLYDHIHVDAGELSEWLLERADGRERIPRARRESP